ncbi:MAG TPA: hypothetical protein VEK34_00765 [Methylocella sp.]|nr:hypothetical protein [Methylocella sp.]
MITESGFYALIDMIYEAAFNGDLWPSVLSRFADAMGSAQVGLLSIDQRAGAYDSVAPRTDPALDALFKSYWAFHNPLLPRAIKRPKGEVYLLERLVSRSELAATPFFHEWFLPAGFGFAVIGANLTIERQIATMLCLGNAPGNDEFSDETMRFFKAVFKHIERAIRLHRELCLTDLDHEAAPARLDAASRGIMLVDHAARVLFANRAARTLLNRKRGLTVKAGYLECPEDRGAIERLIDSCTRGGRSAQGPVEDLWIRRPADSLPLKVMVAPLRSRGNITELPWLGMRIPVAMVIVSEPARERWMQ